MTTGWVRLIEDWLQATHRGGEDVSHLSEVIGAGECAKRELVDELVSPDQLDELPESAGPMRIQSFSLGRIAARRAVARLDLGIETIGRGPSGAPIWPFGLVGSIAHTQDLGIALVGDRSTIGGIGVDVENRQSAGEIRHLVAFDDEHERFMADTGVDNDLLLELFVAKEAVFKAFFPRIGTYFGFDAVRLHPTQAPGRLAGRFVQDLDHEYGIHRPFSVNTSWLDDMIFAWVVLDGED